MRVRAVKGDRDWLAQSNPSNAFQKEVERGGNYIEKLFKPSINKTIDTLHLTRNKYTTQASCIDGKLNLGPKNSV